MSLFKDLFKGAKTIVNKGVSALQDQMSSEYEVMKDSQGTPQVTKDSSVKVAGVKLPAPKIARTARKVFVGESAQERLDRIQTDRQQSLIPSEAERLVREDFAKEMVIANGGLSKDGKYDPEKVVAVGAGPIVGSVKNTGKKVVQALSKKGQVAKQSLADEALKATGDVIKKESPTQLPTPRKSEVPPVFSKGPVPPKVTPPVDMVAKGGQRERSFSKRAAALASDVPMEKQMYDVRNTEELSQKAQNLWKDDPDTAIAYLDDIKSGREVNQDHIAVSSERLNSVRKQLDSPINDPVAKSNLEDEFAELTNATAARLTEMGQATQAAYMLGRQTPEGSARYAAKVIQKHNRANPKDVIPELSSKQADFIARERKAINELPMDEERMLREFNLQNYISDLTPSTLGDKVSSVWKAGLLTGLKTSGLNIAANIGHNTLEDIAKLPASVIDVMVSMVTGKRTNVLTGRGSASGAGEGFARGWKYLMSGYDVRDMNSKLDYNRVNFGGSKIGKVFDGYTKAVFRTIGAQDQPFYYKAVKQSLWSQALADGKNAGKSGAELIKHADDLVKNPTEDILKYAVHDAQTAVFQNRTSLGELAKRVQQTKFKDIPFGQFVLPFAQTPSAVAMQILNYSPAGAVKTIIQGIGKGNFDQRKFSQGLGRSIVGTAPLVIGAEMYKNGLISLNFPKGDPRQQELDKESGKTYNSFRTSKDGAWMQSTGLGPAGNLLIIGAYFQKAFDESGSPTEAMVKAGTGALASFTDQTFVTGVNKFFDAVTDPQRSAGNFIAGLTSSVVPTIVSDTAKAMDPMERESKGESFLDNIKTRTQARVPVARESLPTKVTAYGTEMERPISPIESMVNPFRRSPDRSNELTKEMQRLMGEGQRVAPTKIDDYEGLNPQQKEQLYNMVGDLVNSKLTGLVRMEAYQKLDDEKKGELVNKITEESKKNARARFILTQTDGLPKDELMKELATYKKNGLLTEDVFTVYKKLRSDE